jgi:hypothetical protein
LASLAIAGVSIPTATSSFTTDGTERPLAATKIFAAHKETKRLHCGFMLMTRMKNIACQKL